MNVENAVTLPGNAGEIALTVAFERASAKLAPRLGVVQRGHLFSLKNMLSTDTGQQTLFTKHVLCGTFGFVLMLFKPN